MVRRRKGWRGPREALQNFGEDDLPIHIRRGSPEYTPMPRPLEPFLLEALEKLPREASSDSSSDSSSERKKKKRKKRRSRSRSLSPSSSDSSSSDGHRRSKKKGKKKHKSKHKKKGKHKSTSPDHSAAAPSAAAAAVAARAAAGAATGDSQSDDKIVIFDKASRTFTSEAGGGSCGGIGGPLGAPHSLQGSVFDLQNYRKAFGLSCGNYTFVPEGDSMPAAAAAAVSAAAAAATAAGGPGGTMLSVGGGSQGDRGTRVTPKTHPHLYWSCWKCGALNYKTRHQCIKCNRLFQR